MNIPPPTAPPFRVWSCDRWREVTGQPLRAVTENGCNAMIAKAAREDRKRKRHDPFNPCLRCPGPAALFGEPREIDLSNVTPLHAIPRTHDPESRAHKRRVTAMKELVTNRPLARR